MNKKLHSFSKLLAVAAMVVAGTTNAFGWGNSMYNVYNTKVQTYPAGAGTVYVIEDDGTEAPDESVYQETVTYKSVVYDDDTHTIIPFCKPASGNKLMFGGWKQLSDDDLANIKTNVYTFDNVRLNPSYMNIDCVSSWDTEDEANAAMAEDPTNNLVACFTAAKADVKSGYESLGDIEISPLISDFGDNVTIKLSTLKDDVHVGYWLVNGKRVEATDDALVLENLQDTANVVMVPTSKNLVTVHFPEEGGYKSLFVPGGHEARIIDYAWSGTILRPTNYQSAYSSFLTTNGNTTSTYLGGGLEGVTYLIYGEGDQEYYIYEDEYQWDTPTYLYTAQSSKTVENTDEYLYYTYDAAKVQFNPISEATKIAKDDIYLQIPASEVLDPECPIVLTETKYTEPTLSVSDPDDSKLSAVATDGQTKQYMYNPKSQMFLDGDATAIGSMASATPVYVKYDADNETNTIMCGEYKDPLYYSAEEGTFLFGAPDGVSANTWVLNTTDNLYYTVSDQNFGEDYYMQVKNDGLGTLYMTDYSYSWVFMNEEQFNEFLAGRQAELDNYRYTLNEFYAEAADFRSTLKVATGINEVAATAKEKATKYVENGNVVIVKNGKKFNVAGAQLK